MSEHGKHHEHHEKPHGQHPESNLNALPEHVALEHAALEHTGQRFHYPHERHHRRQAPANRSAGTALLFLLTLLLGLSSLLALGGAAAGSFTFQKSGLITSVEIHYGRTYYGRRDSNAYSAPFYAYDELHLANDGATYIFFRNDFSPSLPANLYNGGEVKTSGAIWYSVSFYPVPLSLVVTAIQLQAPGSQHAERFVTTAFTNPLAAQAAGFYFGGIVGPIAVGMAVWLFLSPER
ncbi:MAG TPA: hypothetical protein VKQ36_15600, partial [Ktedonobacterales bacterium]|nr:hypothetical protein [Ktedonobacterales bacterium]